MKTTNIDSVIKAAKQRLIKEAKIKGLCENFGQIEVRKIEDKFINTSDYSPMMNNNRRKLNLFDEWCMNFDINQLNQ